MVLTRGLAMLEEVGLPPEQERAYRALVQLAQARAGELAARLGLPEPAARALLAELAASGLAAAQPSGDWNGRAADPTYRPLSPEVALGTALVRRQESVETARKLVAQLTDEYHAGLRRHHADRLVEIVHGRAELRHRLRHLQETAQQEIRWFCRANPVAMASTENPEEFAALGRGVSYQVIYERALLAEPGMMANLMMGIRHGEQARSLPELPVRLAVVDRAVAVCPLVPDGGSGEPTAAVVGRSQLLDALLALFESYWQRATPVRLDSAAPVSPAAQPEPDVPDTDEQLLLSLFVAGLPDKAIASQLQVSRRTVQRRLADLMTRAGVDTRPGLAYQAARRSWL